VYSCQDPIALNLARSSILNHQAARADAPLAEWAALLAAAALRPSSRRTYSVGQKDWLRFCTTRNLNPMPPSEGDLVLWVASLALRVSHSTIRNYLAAVASLAAECGFPNITAEYFFLSRVVKGCSSILSNAVSPLRKPITATLLRSFSVFLQPSDLDSAMIFAAMSLGFFALLRSGEFALPANESAQSRKLLRIRQLTIDREQRELCLVIHGAKTDSSGQGQTIRVGRSHASLCPVASMIHYLQLRASLSPLRPQDPLFAFESGRVLTQRDLILILHSLLRAVGSPTSGFSGHSFRIGGASALASAGFSSHDIQIAGRWKSLSFLRYIRKNNADIVLRSNRMAK